MVDHIDHSEDARCYLEPRQDYQDAHCQDAHRQDAHRQDIQYLLHRSHPLGTPDFPRTPLSYTENNCVSEQMGGGGVGGGGGQKHMLECTRAHRRALSLFLS